MKRILHVFPGRIWGGAEQYILDLGQALQADPRFEVRYMARDSRPVRERLDGTVDYTLYSTKALEEAMQWADIVHIHDMGFVGDAVKARRRAGSNTRIILTRHIARGSIVMPWRRGALRQIDALLFVSDIGRRLWTDANRWFDPRKCHVIFNSIPPQTESAPLTPIIGSNGPVIMFTGRVRRSKGCETIVKALGMVKDRPWEMFFVGAPKPADYGDKLMKLATKAGIADRIHLTGFVENARSLVSRANIGVAPSIVREAFGLSPVEFMQQCKAVIATNNGAQPEYITDGVDGLLVDPDNPDQLAAALATLLDNPQRREAIGRAAREKFESEMSYPAFLNKITGIYLSEDI